MVLMLGTIKTSASACGRLFAPLKPQVPDNINVSGLRLDPCSSADVFQLSKNSVGAINKSLKILYNIDSTIKNPDLAKRTFSAVEDFVNLEQANLFAGSVDDLSKAIAGTEYFNGLKVIVDAEKFKTVSTKATLHRDCVTGKAELYINPAYNRKQHVGPAKSDYAGCFHPTMNPKDTYIHELAHWLDFKGNPEKYGKIENAFLNGQTGFNDFGKSITAKVSGYAPYSPAEFNAEYICGRMNGIEYPAATNREFNGCWNGPSLLFENV